MPVSESERYRVTRRVGLIGMGMHIGLALCKILLGIFGHSEALLADGVHSLSDLISDFCVVWGARMGTRLPDSEHPYGHRRIETIMTILVALLMCGVAVDLAKDAVIHLLDHTLKETISLWTLLAASISVVSNESFYRYSLKQANRIQSELLRADAWHNRSDAWVGGVVIVGIIGTALGITILDSLSALWIIILIVRRAYTMIKKNVMELIDTAVDPSVSAAITACAAHTTGVCAVHQLRTRLHGGRILADLHIEVHPRISISEAHYIGDVVTATLKKNIRHIQDITIHIDPENDQENDLCDETRLNREQIEKILKDRWHKMKLQIEKIQLNYLDHGVEIELFLSSKPEPSLSFDVLSECISDFPRMCLRAIYYTHQEF